MTRARALLAAALAPLLLASCTSPAASGLSPLEDAVRRLGAGGAATPRDQALAGFAAYLVDGKPDEAARRFAAAAKAGDPWGAFGQAELARRGLDAKAKTLATLSICELDARHPLCAVAARSALQAVGESPGLDQAIEATALRVLAKGAPGDAAFYLRNAAAAARRARGDRAGAKELWADAGAVSAVALWGPYSRYRFLDWDRPFPPELGEADLGAGPFGAIPQREFSAPDGRLYLGSEPTSGDVHYWAADFQVPAEASYQLHVLGRGAFRVLLDGAVAAERRDFEAWLPEERVIDVTLPAGAHRLVAKVTRGTEREESIVLGLARADGAPSRLAFAPARGAFARRAPQLAPATSSWPDAASLAAALEEEAGSALAAFVAARSAAERDEEGALALAEALVARKACAPFLVVRAETLLANHALPQRFGKGRAHRDLEEALKLDPAEASALQRLSIHARGESRFDEAGDYLERARAAASPGAWRVALSEMRLAQARGADAVADELAQKALALEPGLCDALELRYDLARRFDAVAQADGLLEQLSRCPGSDQRRAEHLRLRGDLAGARELFARLADATPLDAAPRQSEAQLALAQGKALEAAALLERLEKAWPRAALFHKRRAEALDRAGDAKGARAEREAALALDGSDLKLRRALAVEDGKEPLDDLRTDAAPVLARYQAKHGGDPATTSGVYVLDASAVEAHPDGSFTERTHVLAKVLDQEGVSALAEVHLPAGAEVLALRTLKADGRVLEPDALGGKEGVSLPGVEVGDCVEWEYLASTAARGAATPGFTAPKFYFQIADGQLFLSTYTARAPASVGLVVDAHNLPDPPRIRREGDWDVATISREEMPTFVREPGAPSADEVLPFVQAGSGATVEDSLAALGDFLLDRARPNAEVVRFAQQAAGEKVGLAAVQAVYEQVMQVVKGPEASLTARATATLAEERGSRLVLLKGALGALKIPSRLVLVRPFNVDPAKYRFGSSDLYGFAALQVRLPEGEVLLAPGVRFAPFGRIAPQAEGQEAYVLPEIGERPTPLRTPGTREADGKVVKLTVALAADGTLTGKGEETYLGLDAAFLRANLEKMSEDQKKQAIEAAIARTFENGTLTDLSIEEQAASGTPVTLRFSFVAPGFARADGGRLTISRGIYPQVFARRFLQQFERRTPLVVASPEKVVIDVELSLSAGATLEGAPQTTRLDTPYGRFERSERVEPGRLWITEKAALSMTRVQPEQYRAFGDFLTAADRAEQRELAFRVPPAGLAAR